MITVILLFHNSRFYLANFRQVDRFCFIENRNDKLYWLPIFLAFKHQLITWFQNEVGVLGAGLELAILQAKILSELRLLILCPCTRRGQSEYS